VIIHCLHGSRIPRVVDSHESLVAFANLATRPLLFRSLSFYFTRSYERTNERASEVARREKPHRTALMVDRICERDSRRGSMDEGSACRSVRGVIEPRRVQRDRRSAVDPIGRACHVVPRSRCSRRGRRRRECTSRSRERASGRFSPSACPRPSVSIASLRVLFEIQETLEISGKIF